MSKKESEEFYIAPNSRPKVLLLGNGMLKLGNEGTSWETLLKRIKTREIDFDVQSREVPYAMQPEVFCGVDVQQIQRDVAKNIKSIEKSHPLLRELLNMPFDAILTTNYTYEIETIISGKEWSERERKKAFMAMDGKTNARMNTFVCNAVRKAGGRTVPVFHIHGEAERKHSMILSYYSYANALSQLVSYNKERLKNTLYEHQNENKDYTCRCWLDYFIMGDIWSVGLGLDTSEFDLWWAIERKARENAEHGKFKGYFEDTGKTVTSQKLLLEAMGAEYIPIPLKNKNYESMYRQIVATIRDEISKRDFNC